MNTHLRCQSHEADDAAELVLHGNGPRVDTRSIAYGCPHLLHVPRCDALRVRKALGEVGRDPDLAGGCRA